MGVGTTADSQLAPGYYFAIATVIITTIAVDVLKFDPTVKVKITATAADSWTTVYCSSPPTGMTCYIPVMILFNIGSKRAVPLTATIVENPSMCKSLSVYDQTNINLIRR